MNIRTIILAAAALFLCVAAFGQDTKPAPERFIDFEVTQPDGKTERLSDFAGNGKYILVDFWASWCGPCREEIPRLKDLWYEFKGDRFDIVGAPVFDKPENTLAAVSELKIPWKQLLSVPESVPAAYGFNYIPYIILIGPDGAILARDLRGQAIRETVKKYLSL